MKYPYLQESDVGAVIYDTQYHHFPGTSLTVCCMVLSNGFTVVGQSACLNIENFDAKLGEQYAYKDAFNKVYPLLGYALLEHLKDNPAE